MPRRGMTMVASHQLSLMPARLDMVFHVADDAWGGSVACAAVTLSNDERAPDEIENAAVDQEQRAADHDGACDLAPGNAFAQHEITQQQGRHRDQQRHQYDIARARPSQNLKNTI